MFFYESATLANQINRIDVAAFRACAGKANRTTLKNRGASVEQIKSVVSTSQAGQVRERVVHEPGNPAEFVVVIERLYSAGLLTCLIWI
ncbi:MAG: hypothetical protein ACR650_10645 [Methylocystis sp.]